MQNDSDLLPRLTHHTCVYCIYENDICYSFFNIWHFTFCSVTNNHTSLVAGKVARKVFPAKLKQVVESCSSIPGEIVRLAIDKN